MPANLISFTSLLTELSLASHGGPKHKTACSNEGYPALRIFARWVNELRRCFTPYSNGTTHIIFRLLFPEEDIRRKYGMQEKLLGSALTQLIGIKPEELQCWNSAQGSGCLGQEVQKIFAVRSSEIQGNNKLLTIADIDDLLDELASTCEYSHASLQLKYPSPRSRSIILRHLYSTLTPADASFVTQMILKDLQPLIYPLPTRHATSALRNYNASSYKPLRIEDAMRVWDPSNRLLKSYRLTSTIGDFYEGVDVGQEMPRTGVFIEIPKSRKGRGCLDALSYLRRSNRVWAETKYDGERAQIHVEILSDVEESITIFSKSKRDSTEDRRVIHDIIRQAIGFNSMRKVKQNVVLDAEMVACLDNKIDEFWKIRRLLEDRTTRTSTAPNEALGHLGLVFFDVMVLDSRPLIRLPYCERRKILESLIQTSTGQIYLAERTPIDLDSDCPEQNLQAVFAQSITNFEEGVILKAEESFYNDHGLPWVKLKKDYIPDYGDAIDLVLLGAAWDKERARELRVPPTVFTTFFLGALTNAKEMEANASTKPHFYLSIGVSYGMTRGQVEELNFIIGTLNPLGYDQFKRSPDSVQYTITLCPAISNFPTIILKRPLLAELFGAGFSKPLGGEFYELRFPRITKVYNEEERSWRDGIDFQQLQAIAYYCTGQDRTFKDVDDWCNNLWGKEMSPGVRSRAKRKVSVATWQDKLAMWDRRTDQSALRSPSKKRRPSPFMPPGGALEELSAKLHDLVTSSNPKGFLPFLETALIWFSKGENKHKLAWKQHVSPGNCVHSLESLLVGCGWDTTPCHETQKLEGVERGLAVVHDVKWKRFTLEAIDKAIEKCKSDYDKNGTQDRKPILVIDISEASRLLSSMFKSVRFSASLRYFKPFSTIATPPNRAIVYARNGDPADVLRVIDYPTLPPPEPHTLNIRFLLSPINPADVNVIEGIYPVKAESITNLSSLARIKEKPIFIGGNEGLAEVAKTGNGVAGLHEGDWVVMTRQQAGTWCSERNVQMGDVLKIPMKQSLTEAEAATITVNPPTAYNMLHEFVSLQSGDWLVQNGANSAVGQAVIQIAVSEGIKSLNFVRNRDDYGALREYLLELGASDVMTYDDLSDKSKVETIRAMTAGNIRLGLNCVGGKETAMMSRLLGEDSHLVSYGAMSKQPLSLPSSLFIFRNITAHGFWQSRWYRDKPQVEKEAMIHKMVQLISGKKLAAPAHEIITISACESCEQATNKVKSMFSQLSGGRYGKKILLKFQS